MITLGLIVSFSVAGEVFMKLDIFVLMFSTEHEIQICVFGILRAGALIFNDITSLRF